MAFDYGPYGWSDPDVTANVREGEFDRVFDQDPPPERYLEPTRKSEDLVGADELGGPAASVKFPEQIEITGRKVGYRGEDDMAIESQVVAVRDFGPPNGSKLQIVSLDEVTEPVTSERGDDKRLDAGKPDGFWLLPWRPLTALAHVYSIGARKYSPRGWERGMEWSRILDPAMRHLGKWLAGERYDKVDGQHHLASVVWAMFALMEYEETHPELDNIHDEELNPLHD
jgi:hypothetical protein